MCGVAGVFVEHGIVDRRKALMMTQTLTHRGPDDLGSVMVNSNQGFFGHTRLAIQDLSENGHQPMQSPSGRYTLVLNGEIYNALRLRSEYLSDDAVTLHGHSDTEILIWLIERYGFEKSLPWLFGMFAIACWDAKERRVYLARDRMGEKPLYYGFCNQTFVFASEIRAIHSYLDGQLQVNTQALADYLRFSYVPTPHTIFAGINKLPPAHFLRFDTTSFHQTGPVAYPIDDSKLLFLTASHKLSGSHCLEDTLLEVIADQQLSDRPVGAFLSGGIDSSLVVALLQRLSGDPIKTFTIGFDQDAYNESTYAEKIARYLGCEHTTQMLSVKDVVDSVSSLSAVYDEPFADSSQLPTLCLSRLARTQVAVALTGDGADELFGGYNRYHWAVRINQKLFWLPARVRKFLATLMRTIPPSIVRFIASVLPNRFGVSLPEVKWQKLLDVMRTQNIAELYRCLVSTHLHPSQYLCGTTLMEQSDDFQSHFSHSLDLVSAMMLLDQNTYLPDDILVKVDRAAMSVGLETRAPYLDPRVVHFAKALGSLHRPGIGNTKAVLRDILARYLPNEFFQRPKMGFAMPLDHWLKNGLKPMVDDVLNTHNALPYQYIKRSEVLRLWHDFLSGRHANAAQVWNLFMLVSWFGRWHQPTSATSDFKNQSVKYESC